VGRLRDAICSLKSQDTRATMGGKFPAANENHACQRGRQISFSPLILYAKVGGKFF
jgi:hypothetical protein